MMFRIDFFRYKFVCVHLVIDYIASLWLCWMLQACVNLMARIVRYGFSGFCYNWTAWRNCTRCIQRYTNEHDLRIDQNCLGKPVLQSVDI